MADIPFVTQPLSAGNLHQVINWLISEVNKQNAGSETPPEQFRPQASGASTEPKAPPEPKTEEHETRDPPHPPSRSTGSRG
jgi:hypothetical protein